MRRTFLALAALAIGCGGPSNTGPPIEVIPAMYHVDQTLIDVRDGDTISLEFPPQGGHVLFVGARLRNLDDALVTLRARLRSAVDNSIVGEEARTIEFLPSEDATLRIPDLRSYSNVCNVPMCPSYTEHDLYDQPFLLEVEATELSTERTGTAQRMVVPSCLQADATLRASCQCECQANYVLGKCNPM
jgi:hypothetical protein